MADYPRKLNRDGIVASQGRQIRRIRTRSPTGLFDPLTDGTPFLCDGWSAAFAVIGEPPEHTGSSFGFYRDAGRVYWRGGLSYEGVTSGNPDITHPANDAIQLCVPNQDATGTTVSGSGAVLPQAFWPSRTLLFNVPADNENSVGFVYGRWAQLLIRFDGTVLFQGIHGSGTAVMVSGADTAGANNQPRDSSNRAHLGVPSGTYLDFEGVNYRPRY